ncbi:MAG: HEAT repeat domain-containing protein [Candidatus Micrarchaeota archaeon]
MAEEDRVEWWVQKLNSGEPMERWMAVDRLLRIAKEREIAENALIDSLKSPSWFVRTRAIDALRKLGVVHAIEPLLEKTYIEETDQCEMIERIAAERAVVEIAGKNSNGMERLVVQIRNLSRKMDEAMRLKEMAAKKDTLEMTGRVQKISK